MTDNPILVLAATGGQGRAVTDALLDRGAGVRALVQNTDDEAARRLADRGVQVVAGDLSDRASMAAAMKGVAGVFAYTTPFVDGVEAEVAQGQAILAAAGQQRVPHLVFSSLAMPTRGPAYRSSKARHVSKPNWSPAMCLTRSSDRRLSWTWSTSAARNASSAVHWTCRSTRTSR